MTVITNNILPGAVDGVGRGTGSGFVPAGLNVGVGDPSDVLTAQTGSDIFWDSTNEKYYMALGQGGSTWVSLGSVSA